MAINWDQINADLDNYFDITPDDIYNSPWYDLEDKKVDDSLMQRNISMACANVNDLSGRSISNKWNIPEDEWHWVVDDIPMTKSKWKSLVQAAIVRWVCFSAMQGVEYLPLQMSTAQGGMSDSTNGYAYEGAVQETIDYMKRAGEYVKLQVIQTKPEISRINPGARGDQNFGYITPVYAYENFVSFYNKIVNKPGYVANGIKITTDKSDPLANILNVFLNFISSDNSVSALYNPNTGEWDLKAVGGGGADKINAYEGSIDLQPDCFAIVYPESDSEQAAPSYIQVKDGLNNLLNTTNKGFVSAINELNQKVIDNTTAIGGKANQTDLDTTNTNVANNTTALGNKIDTLTSTNGSVQITGTGTTRDLSVSGTTLNAYQIEGSGTSSQDISAQLVANHNYDLMIDFSNGGTPNQVGTPIANYQANGTIYFANRGSGFWELTNGVLSTGTAGWTITTIYLIDKGVWAPMTQKIDYNITNVEAPINPNIIMSDEDISNSPNTIVSTNSYIIEYQPNDNSLGTSYSVDKQELTYTVIYNDGEDKKISLTAIADFDSPNANIGNLEPRNDNYGYIAHIQVGQYDSTHNAIRFVFADIDSPNYTIKSVSVYKPS